MVDFVVAIIHKRIRNEVGDIIHLHHCKCYCALGYNDHVLSLYIIHDRTVRVDPVQRNIAYVKIVNTSFDLIARGDILFTVLKP